MRPQTHELSIPSMFSLSRYVGMPGKVGSAWGFIRGSAEVQHGQGTLGSFGREMMGKRMMSLIRNYIFIMISNLLTIGV
jgi:hypothetical protein